MTLHKCKIKNEYGIAVQYLLYFKWGGNFQIKQGALSRIMIFFIASLKSLKHKKCSNIFQNINLKAKGTLEILFIMIQSKMSYKCK